MHVWREGSVSEDGAVALDRATQALESGDWQRAERAFEQAVAQAPSGVAHRGLGEALWWQGRIADAIAHREQAVAAFVHEGRYLAAASMGLRLAVDYHSNVGNRSASAGWLARSRSLIDQHDLEPLVGWADMVSAFTSGDAHDAEARARAALGRARDVGDRDLELQTLSVLGSVLVAQARIDEGTACLDEAMAGALGGEPEDPQTVVFTSCNMIKACTSCADLERAIEWVHAADRFRESFGCAFLYATCRTQYGRVLTLTGDWERADEELTAALHASQGSLPAIHADAAAALASLRLHQGRHEDARSLVAGSEWHPEAAVVSAALHLLDGATAPAESVLRRCLDQVDPGGLVAGLLTEQLGHVALARGAMDEAGALARTIATTAADTGCRILEARGHRLAGLAAAPTDAGRARHDLGAAISTFERLGCVHEAARTRAALALSLEEQDPEVAATEARVAHGVFDALGARPDADAAAALLRRLGHRVTTTRGDGGDLLTAREREVLGLVRDGLSNPEIAERLFLSRRTVEHHVAAILRKLGVSSRTQAAVHPAASAT